MVSQIYRRSPVVDKQTLIERCERVSAFLRERVADRIHIKVLEPVDLINLQDIWGKTVFPWRSEDIKTEFPTSQIILGLYHEDTLVGISESFLEVVGDKDDGSDEVFQIRRETTERKPKKHGNLIAGTVSACFHEMNLQLAKTLGADYISSYMPDDNTSRLNEALGFTLDLTDPLAPSYVLPVRDNSQLNWSALQR